MRLQYVALLASAVLTILCSVGFANPHEAGDAPSPSTSTKVERTGSDASAHEAKPDAVLSQALADVKAEMVHYNGQFNSSGRDLQTGESRIRLDRAIREAIGQGFRQGLSFQQVQAQLQLFLRWQAIPQAVAVGSQPGTRPGETESPIPGFETGWSDEPEPDERMPVILYKVIDRAAGGTLYLLQNSFACRHGGTLSRDRWDVYSVFTDASGVWTGSVSGFCERTAGVMDFKLFLAGSPTNPEGAPGVALIEGPDGSGHFVRAHTYWFDAKQKTWAPREVQEFAGVGGWSYDAGKCRLTVHYDFEEAGELQGESQVWDLSTAFTEVKPEVR